VEAARIQTCVKRTYLEREAFDTHRVGSLHGVHKAVGVPDKRFGVEHVHERWEVVAHKGYAAPRVRGTAQRRACALVRSVCQQLEFHLFLGIIFVCVLHQRALATNFV
jgi:hypothetical protein